MSINFYKGQVDELIREMITEFPKLEFHSHKPWWLKFGFKCIGSDADDFTQTIGNHIYYCGDWDELSDVRKYTTLRHELIHLRQFRKYGFVLFSLLYLLCFFPIGLAYFRARFEREGYKESLKAKVEIYGPTESIKEQGWSGYKFAFLTKAYLWAWPFKSQIEKWFMQDWIKVTRK